MKTILGKKYELRIITGNVVTGTNDSFVLSTDVGQTSEVPTTDNFSVDVSQRVTVAWSKELEFVVEPSLIFLYNHDSNNKHYTLPIDLQEAKFKLSIKSSVRSLLQFFLILTIGNLLYTNLVGFPAALIFNSGCPAVVSYVINLMITLLFSIGLVVFFVRKSIKSYHQNNETHFWIIKTLAAIARFIGRNTLKDEGIIGVDAAIDFPIRKRLCDVIKCNAASKVLADQFDERRKTLKTIVSSQGDAGKNYVAFLDNHDLNERFHQQGVLAFSRTLNLIR